MLLLRLLFILFIISPCTAFAKDPLAICTIFQNDADWLREWIEFHRIQGCKHFYLYNNCSRDNYSKALQPYIDSGVVTLIDWDYTYPSNRADIWLKIQTKAYMHCIEHYKDKAEWIAFIDSDEYLFCVDGTKLPVFLKKYKDYGGLFVNWRLFGTSNVKRLAKGELMIEKLTRCSIKDLERNNRVKVIVQPEYVKECDSPHHFVFKYDKYDVNEHFQKRNGSIISHTPISHDLICINHYWTRTEDHFNKRKMKSRNKRRKQETFSVLQKMADQYNQKKDKKILQFVPELKKRMRNK